MVEDRVLWTTMKRAWVFLLVLLQTLPAFSDSPIVDFDFTVQTSSEAEAPVYAAGADGGVWVSFDEGKSWSDRSAGLPVRVIYPFDGSRMRRIESLSYDPVDPVRLAVATPYGVHVSDNAGDRWRAVDISEPIKSVDHLTAVALSPWDGDTLFVGTSFNGLFTSTDSGRSWVSHRNSLQHLYLGAGFYETITAIAVSPVRTGHLLMAVGIRGEVFESFDAGRNWSSIGIPGGSRARLPDTTPESTPENPPENTGAGSSGVSGSGAAANLVRTLSFTPSGDTWTLRAATAGGEAYLRRPDGTWERTEPLPSTAPIPLEAEAARRNASSGRTGIYVNPAWTSGEKLETHLELLKANGMDTIVVDMKDDFGRVTFDAKNAVSARIGSVAGIFDLDELLSRAHEAGVYVVGRIVVFQDPKLYAYEENAYAVWDGEAEAPWANMIHVSGSEKDGNAKYEQREFWVDPFSEFVWRYNIAIAEELAARGVDEIQFDYIRFPSDGDTSRIHYRYRRDGMTRADAIESFLVIAREHLEIPISADLYGFNAWYLMGGWIGQNIDMVADYVDVICPMFYPSHFPGAFLGELDYVERAERIYTDGSNNAAAHVGARCSIRPYVQAFLIGGERKFETPEYTAYLARQLDGVLASHASGFTLWNASNIYYMVTESLERYTSAYEPQDISLTD